MNDKGVQNCRRCGKVLADLMYPGHRAFLRTEVFQIEQEQPTRYYGPGFFGDDERRDAVLCDWQVH